MQRQKFVLFHGHRLGHQGCGSCLHLRESAALLRLTFDAILKKKKRTQNKTQFVAGQHADEDLRDGEGPRG